MIFLTVGTQFPFDRLVKAVDEAVKSGLVSEEVYGQIGKARYHPKYFDAVDSLSKDDFDSKIDQAGAILGHAGMGTITMAMEKNKPLLVMPRLAKYREVVNDHQVGIAKRYSDEGYLLAALCEKELHTKIVELRVFQPRLRTCCPEVVAGRVRDYIESIQNANRK